MILKKIAGISFIISFLMALVLFGGIGSNIVDRMTAKSIFLIAGAIGLLLNFISFRFGKGDVNFNFFYWLGSLVVFVGLTFLIMHWKYGLYIVMGGTVMVGVSFFYNPKIDNDNSSKDDLLDDPF